MAPPSFLPWTPECICRDTLKPRRLPGLRCSGGFELSERAESKWPRGRQLLSLVPIFRTCSQRQQQKLQLTRCWCCSRSHLVPDSCHPPSTRGPGSATASGSTRRQQRALSAGQQSATADVNRHQHSCRNGGFAATRRP